MEEKYYFDKNAFSIEEYKDAAQELFDKGINEFESIKNREWYQKFMSALNLGNGDKKVMIHQIKNTQEFFRLFLAVYEEDLKLQDDQLDTIVSELLKERDDINHIYELVVLQLDRNNSLKELLDDRSKYILLLALGKASAFYEYNENVGRYNKSIADYLDVDFVQTELTEKQLEEVNKPDVLYRCLAEQRAVSGLASFPEGVETIVESLAVSEKRKRTIDQQVIEEINGFTLDYIFSKYDRKISIELTENVDKGEVVERRPTGLGCSFISYQNNEWQIDSEYDYEVEEIGVLHVLSSEHKKFKNRKLVIKGSMLCSGQIDIEDCIIEFVSNGESPAIVLAEGATLNLIDSFMNSVLTDGTTPESFVSCNENTEIVIDGCTFYSCGNFIRWAQNYTSGCKKIIVSNCKMINCSSNFMRVKSEECIFKNCVVMYDDHMKELSSHQEIFYLPGDTVIENSMFCNESSSKGLDDLYYFMDAKNGITLKNCTFIGDVGRINVKAVCNCKFVNVHSVRVTEDIKHCLFNNSSITWANTISECIFYNCSGSVISVLNPIVIDSCRFINITNCSETEPGAYPSIISVCKAKSSKKGDFVISNSEFSKIYMSKNYLVVARSDYHDTFCMIKNCSFNDCYTTLNNKKLINEYVGRFETLTDIIFQRTPKKDKTIQIKDCVGLDSAHQMSEMPEFMSISPDGVNESDYGCDDCIK